MTRLIGVSQASYPPKPRPGDRVAVVSPSSGLPGLFPRPYELGLQRLREEFDLVPVEFPATRRMGSMPAERATDLHAAFADPDITAVISTIGGDDQITLLRHLDKELIRSNPKPFFGYSDSTNLLIFLSNLGIVAYHGGAVMTDFGRAGALHPVTAASLRAALLGSGAYDLPETAEYSDVDRPWDDTATFAAPPPTAPCSGWRWHGEDRVVEGVLWGGNLEILSWLAIETSEELPSATTVYRILRNMGERGMLRRFPAVLVGRAKAWSFERPNGPEEKAAYAREQRETVLRALGEYNPGALAVFDVDFGHTDPRVVLPIGGRIRVDGPARRITVHY